jgi:hypothetical protein
MKTNNEKLLRRELQGLELQSIKGGFILPFLLARAVVRGVQLIESAIEWLTTEH